MRLDQSDTATRLFDAVWRTAPTPALRAAGAFWAGHVAQRGGDRGRFAIWMRRATQEGGTFYSLIARRALGPAIGCVPGETIGNADLEALEATPQGRRAFALLQVGENLLAEAELRALWADTDRMACSIAHWSWPRARWASPSWLRRSSNEAWRDQMARVSRGCGLPAASWSIRRWSMRWSAANRISIPRQFRAPARAV